MPALPIRRGMQAEITQLISYPIKSCAGIKHQVAEVNKMGLFNDRRWMLVDGKGLFLSQRKFPQMALIQPKVTLHILQVDAPGMDKLCIKLDEVINKTMAVKVWHDQLFAESVSIAANQWFSTYLKTEVYLVHYGEVSQRLIDPEFAQADQTVAFADGFPLLITHESSLKALNQMLSTAVDMSRFRPNVVISTSQNAWDEHNWQSLSNSLMQMNLVKPCVRCVMTGIEQSTGVQTGTEVLRTLKQQFAHQNKAIFGMNAITQIHSDTLTELKVGMTLKIV